MTSTFVDRIAHLAQTWWEGRAEDRGGGHRELMRVVATGLALRLVSQTIPGSHADAIAAMTAHARRLATLQGADGLFSSDANLHSPPDSAFTLNDLAVTLALLERLADPALDPLEHELGQIARRALPALVTGGVHTPNHRWEISAALVRLAALDERALTRAEEWLSEGIDVDADGIYSERSANYAALVSNPSLLAIADALDRPDLLDVVHRNLHSYLLLTDADGLVETVFSRRQDHNKAIPVALFHTQLRRFALEGCPTCLAGARASEPTSDRVAVTALLDVAAEPALAEELSAAREPGASEATRHFDAVGLLVRERAGVRSVVYGGSDVPHAGRVGSGVAANPTFLRYRSGAAVIRSLRLSRVFFGLGPFRANGLVVDDDGAAHLRERVAARYYQPLPAGSRRPDGDYRLEDDGRFSASMSFSERDSSAVELRTDIRVAFEDDGLELQVTTSGADTRWSLELALGEGELTGVERVGEQTYRMTGETAVLHNGSDAVVISTTAHPQPDTVGFYEPGEAYAFLGGTDALTGPRLYLTGTTPSTWTLTLQPA